MRRTRFPSCRTTLVVCALLVPLVSLPSSCSTTEGSVALGAGVVTAIGAHAPSQEIQQIYYVGVFDPLEQIPPAVYRFTVHGQASAISSARFASGWAPAAMVDSLGTSLSFDENGQMQLQSKDKLESSISPSRRLVMFGPEGFRESPKDHRLVIVMGSSPEKFFDAVGESLETVVKIQQEQLDSRESQRILAELYRLQREQRELDVLSSRAKASAAKAKEG